MNVNEEGIDRDTLILITIIGGPPATLTWLLYQVATYLGPKIRTEELRPLTPLEGLPIPAFIKRKPEVWKGLKERMRIREKGK